MPTRYVPNTVLLHLKFFGVYVESCAGWCGQQYSQSSLCSLLFITSGTQKNLIDALCDVWYVAVQPRQPKVFFQHSVHCLLLNSKCRKVSVIKLSNYTPTDHVYNE